MPYRVPHLIQIIVCIAPLLNSRSHIPVGPATLPGHSYRKSNKRQKHEQPSLRELISMWQHSVRVASGILHACWPGLCCKTNRIWPEWISAFKKKFDHASRCFGHLVRRRLIWLHGCLRCSLCIEQSLIYCQGLGGELLQRKAAADVGRSPFSMGLAFIRLPSEHCFDRPSATAFGSA